MSKATTLPVICLTLSLASCSGFARVENSPSCPQPSTSLLVPVPPLAKDGDAAAVKYQDVLVQYAEDIGRYETLRLQHSGLQQWVQACAAPSK